MNLVLLSGISGSGKSVALRALEDFGFYCVDNIPLELLAHLIIWHRKKQIADKLAVSIDSRSKTALHRLKSILSSVQEEGDWVRILFLEAKEEVLLQRYLETRRMHPLHDNYPLLKEAIAKEKVLLDPIRELSLIVDTSYMQIRTLRQWIREWIGVLGRSFVLIFESFGFKFGVPSDANYVFDVRCLPNPYYSIDLRQLAGSDKKIEAFFEKFTEVEATLEHIFIFLNRSLPLFQDSDALTVAIGCTGGIHRSVYMVEKLARAFEAEGYIVLTRHRQLLN